MRDTIDFKEYYEGPFEWHYDFSSKVFTKNGKMAFDFVTLLVSSMLNLKDVLSKKQMSDIVKCLNDEIDGFIKSDMHFDEDSALISVKFEGDKDMSPIILIRGWGSLIGQGALKLSIPQALKIQKDFANYVIKKLKYGSKKQIPEEVPPPLETKEA